MNVNDLKAFCSRNKSIYSLYPSDPWRKNGYWHATDGCIYVRLKAPGCEESDLGAFTIPIDVDKLPWEEAKRGRRLKSFPLLNSLPARPEPPCKTCAGTGYATFCEECDGEGVVCFSNDYHEYEFECKTCKGTKYFASQEHPCPDCGGIPNYLQANLELEKGCWFKRYYLEKIIRLPSVRYYNPPLKRPRWGVVHRVLLYFEFTGGRGMLAGVRL